MFHEPRDDLQQILAAAALEPAVGAAITIRALAHEVKNALNPVGLQIELLRRRVPDDPQIERVVEGIAEAVRRADLIMERAIGLAQEAGPGSRTDPALAGAFARLTAAIAVDPPR
jgi:signal transduction histidine kinase